MSARGTGTRGAAASPSTPRQRGQAAGGAAQATPGAPQRGNRPQAQYAGRGTAHAPITFDSDGDEPVLPQQPAAPQPQPNMQGQQPEQMDVVDLTQDSEDEDDEDGGAQEAAHAQHARPAAARAAPRPAALAEARPARRRQREEVAVAPRRVRQRQGGQGQGAQPAPPPPPPHQQQPQHVPQPPHQQQQQQQQHQQQQNVPQPLPQQQQQHQQHQQPVYVELHDFPNNGALMGSIKKNIRVDAKMDHCFASIIHELFTNDEYRAKPPGTWILAVKLNKIGYFGTKRQFCLGVDCQLPRNKHHQLKPPPPLHPVLISVTGAGGVDIFGGYTELSLDYVCCMDCARTVSGPGVMASMSGGNRQPGVLPHLRNMSLHLPRAGSKIMVAPYLKKELTRVVEQGDDGEKQGWRKVFKAALTGGRWQGITALLPDEFLQLLGRL